MPRLVRTHAKIRGAGAKSDSAPLLVLNRYRGAGSREVHCRVASGFHWPFVLVTPKTGSVRTREQPFYDRRRKVYVVAGKVDRHVRAYIDQSPDSVAFEKAERIVVACKRQGNGVFRF